MAVQTTHACNSYQSTMQTASLSYAAATLLCLQPPRTVLSKQWRHDNPFAYTSCKFKNHSFFTQIHVLITLTSCKIAVWWHENLSISELNFGTSISAIWNKGYLLKTTLLILFNPGELEVAAEFSTKDSDATGSVDFVILLNSFVISVVEVRTLQPICYLSVHSQIWCQRSQERLRQLMAAQQ